MLRCRARSRGTHVASTDWMPADLPEIPTTIRDRLLADHRRLDAQLVRLLAAMDANDREDTRCLWGEIEDGLVRHMDTEERHLLPTLHRAAPGSARILVQEHRHIRARLAELGLALDLHRLRLDAARAFAAELRAHAESEDRLLYQGADERLDATEKASLLQVFEERLGTHGVRRGARHLA